jgi:hypothetical protein
MDLLVGAIEIFHSKLCGILVAFRQFSPKIMFMEYFFVSFFHVCFAYLCLYGSTIKIWSRPVLHFNLSQGSRKKFVQSGAPRALLSLITPSTRLDFGLPWFKYTYFLSWQKKFLR